MEDHPTVGLPLLVLHFGKCIIFKIIPEQRVECTPSYIDDQTRFLDTTKDEPFTYVAKKMPLQMITRVESVKPTTLELESILLSFHN